MRYALRCPRRYPDGTLRSEPVAGTAVVDNVFALPGLGADVVLATTAHDLIVVDGVALYFTLIVVIVFMAADVANTWLSPRQRTAARGM